MTLLLTTHYMDEAEALADRVGIIDHGKIVVEGSPRELIDRMGADNIRIVGSGNSDTFLENVKSLPYVESFNASNGIVQVGVDSGSRRLAEIVETANKSEFHNLGRAVVDRGRLYQRPVRMPRGVTDQGQGDDQADHRRHHADGGHDNDDNAPQRHGAGIACDRKHRGQYRRQEIGALTQHHRQ